jgi:uncharacterized protein (DUF1330 family)
MVAYVIGEADIIDPEAMKAYGPLIGAAVAKFGGRYLARGAKPQVLEGGPAHNMLIIEFDSVETARRWYASPEYAKAKAVGQGASNLRLVVIDAFVKDTGLAQPGSPTEKG